MRKYIQTLLLVIAATALTAVTGFAQGQGVYLKQVPKIITGGKFNSSTIAAGSATASAVTERDYSVFPLYSKIDTVTNTAADTVYQQIKGYCNSVYVWANVTSISGTNTSCTVKVQATAGALTGNSNADVWETLQTYTVSATGNPYKVLVNSGSGWPYTNIRVIFTGSGTQVSSWYCGLMIR